MGGKLLRCSGSEVVQKFQKAGWAAVRHKGSHVMMTKPGYQWTLYTHYKLIFGFQNPISHES